MSVAAAKSAFPWSRCKEPWRTMGLRFVEELRDPPLPVKPRPSRRPDQLSAMPDDADQSAGARLRRLRLARSMTLSQLAAAAHVSSATLWTIEGGKPIRYRPKTLAAIARALGVGVDAIFSEEAMGES